MEHSSRLRILSLHQFPLLLFLILSGSLRADVISREDALRAAFPDAEIRSEVIFLTEDQMREASERSGVEIKSALVSRFIAVSRGNIVGIAYLDTHVIRTKKESLLVILHPDGKIRRIEKVAFLEPSEYIPPDLWYQQFEGKELNNDLQLDAGIRRVTGATLTAQATTAAVRRVLAVDSLLRIKDHGKAEE